MALLCLPWALLVAGSSLGSDVLNGPVDVLAESALANTAQSLGGTGGEPQGTSEGHEQFI